MSIPAKFLGAMAAVAAGSLIFLAPEAVTSSRTIAGKLPIDSAHAEPDPEVLAHVKSINDADDAYFEAAMDIERYGETPSNLMRLKAADDVYFQAVMAMEIASEQARQLARIEAADDAYFEAAMLVEITGGTKEHLEKLQAADDAYFEAVMSMEQTADTATQLAELDAEEERLRQEQLLAQTQIVQVDDPNLVTGSLPPDYAAVIAADPMTRRLVDIRKAGDDSYDAAEISHSRQDDWDALPQPKIDPATIAAAAEPAGNVDPEPTASIAAAAGAKLAAITGRSQADKKAHYLPHKASVQPGAERRTEKPVRRKRTAAVRQDEPRRPIRNFLRMLARGIGIAPKSM